MTSTPNNAMMAVAPAGGPAPAHLQPPSNAQYYPGTPGDASGSLPINLDSLRDGPPGTKPFYPYSTLIRYAIKGSPQQKLLLEDIYYAIEMRFPYFRTAPSGWKNSVRHNLSLNPCFEKVPRPLTDRGKGSYWTVNDNVDPRTGVHRVRKRRGAKGSKAQTQQQNEYKQEAVAAADAQAGYNPAMYADSADPQRYPPGMINPDGPGPSRVYAPYPQFDPSAFPMGMRYPADRPGEEDEDLGPEVDENGEPNWRVMWLNELARMQAMTSEQEKNNGGDVEWYRMMVTRVRTAFSADHPDMQHIQVTETADQ